MTPSPNAMWRSWLLLGVIIFILSIVALRSGGPNKIGQAALSGSKLFVSVFPNLILGFLLAGFIHVLVPAELISQWMGNDSGIKGLMAGTLVGMITPGGP